MAPNLKKGKRKQYKAFASGWNLIASFGITLLVGIWITLTVGKYIDEFLSTGVLFQLLGVIVAIISAFRLLLEAVDDMEKKEAKEKNDS